MGSTTTLKHCVCTSINLVPPNTRDSAKPNFDDSGVPKSRAESRAAESCAHGPKLSEATHLPRRARPQLPSSSTPSKLATPSRDRVDC
jgi:hypothetical protein